MSATNHPTDRTDADALSGTRPTSTDTARPPGPPGTTVIAFG